MGNMGHDQHDAIMVMYLHQTSRLMPEMGYGSGQGETRPRYSFNSTFPSLPSVQKARKRRLCSVDQRTFCSLFAAVQTPGACLGFKRPIR